jgi:hypothetical protein
MQTTEGAFAALDFAYSGRSQAEFESDVLRLSPQEARLYQYLRDHGVASTIDVRQKLAIGNVSQAAALLNRKLQQAGEGLKVVCELRPQVNRFGNRGHIGYYYLVDASGNAA